MQPGAEDNHVVDALTLTLGGKDLGLEQQSPEKRMHGFRLVLGGLTLGPDWVGIGDGNVIARATGQDKEARKAYRHPTRAKRFLDDLDTLAPESHAALLMVLLWEGVNLMAEARLSSRGSFASAAGHRLYRWGRAARSPPQPASVLK